MGYYWRDCSSPPISYFSPSFDWKWRSVSGETSCSIQGQRHLDHLGYAHTLILLSHLIWPLTFKLSLGFSEYLNVVYEMETSAGGTSIFEVCNMPISLFSPPYPPLYQSYSTGVVNPRAQYTPNSSRGLAIILILLAVLQSTTSSPFPPLQSSQLQAIPFHEHSCTPPSSAVTLHVSISSHFDPSGQRRWLDRFPMPSMRSRDGFWAVMSREGGRWRGRTRSMLISPSYLSPGSEHYEMRLEHTQHFGQYLLLFTKHQAAVNVKSRRLFPGSAQHPSRKKTEPSLMVDTFSGSGYSGWSARETWWPGWMGRTCKEAMEQGP